MPASFSEEKKQQWKERISAQKNSGLSVAEWCRQNEILDHVFYYWKRKFTPAQAVSISSFTEISLERKSCRLESAYSGIKIEYQEIHIHLDKHFDSAALKQCLSVLKELSC